MARREFARDEKENICIFSSFIFFPHIDFPDNCAVNPCLNNGKCINFDNGFQCECADGFNGTTCNEVIGESKW